MRRLWARCRTRLRENERRQSDLEPTLAAMRNDSLPGRQVQTDKRRSVFGNQRRQRAHKSHSGFLTQRLLCSGSGHPRFSIADAQIAILDLCPRIYPASALAKLRSLAPTPPYLTLVLPDHSVTGLAPKAVSTICLVSATLAHIKRD